jgi:myosin heavy subunit
LENIRSRLLEGKETKFLKEKEFKHGHYSEEVVYLSSSIIKPKISEFKVESKNSFIQSLIKKFGVLDLYHKTKLDEFLQIISATDIHLVQCLLPNYLKKPKILDPILLLKQVTWYFIKFLKFFKV